MCKWWQVMHDLMLPWLFIMERRITPHTEQTKLYSPYLYDKFGVKVLSTLAEFVLMPYK